MRKFGYGRACSRSRILAGFRANNGPTGHIQQFAALRVRSGSTSLPWTRDPEDIYTIHVDVPANADRIAVDFDTLLENTISDHPLLLAWNAVVLCPRGIDKRQLLIEPSILLPANWHQGSSLRVRGQTGNRLNFAPVSRERLIAASVLADEFFRSLPLASTWPAELDITGDSQAAVDRADDEFTIPSARSWRGEAKLKSTEDSGADGQAGRNSPRRASQPELGPTKARAPGARMINRVPCARWRRDSPGGNGHPLEITNPGKSPL
jgi:hypothetical protein